MNKMDIRLKITWRCVECGVIVTSDIRAVSGTDLHHQFKEACHIVADTTMTRFPISHQTTVAAFFFTARFNPGLYQAVLFQQPV